MLEIAKSSWGMMDTISRLGNALRDRYDIERELGHGGMATVFLARDLRHERPVAIKVLHPELAAAVGAERFLREIRIAAQLQHPHILTLIDSGDAEGLLFYVMPYVEGVSLRDRVAAGTRVTVSETIRLMRDVVDALAYAHRQGVVHRDIKPDNVMVSERHAMVVDFGVAKAMRDATSTHALTSIGISLGTPAYMAPEQAAADPAADHRVDIYSVGVMLYELLTGRTPFSGSPQQVLAAHISVAPDPVREVNPEVPPAVAGIVMKCLEKDPGARFQSADDLRDAIESLSTPGAGTPPLVRPASRFATSRVLVASAAVALVLAVTGWKAFERTQRQRWVNETAIPELRRLGAIAGGADIVLMDSAWHLARAALAISPEDPALDSAIRLTTTRLVIRTEPAGATVFRTRYDDSTSWVQLGVTPTDSVILPLGISRYRLEAPGYRTAILASHTGGLRGRTIHLDALTSPDSGMVWVSGGERVLAGAIGLDHEKPVKLADFHIDRHEVTNAQFKKFVDAGGYSNREYWTEPFVSEGRALTWDQAMKLFVDRTGRPGPSTWEGGGPKAGDENLPVGGVSWFEAAAYARFAGKRLPTVFHWSQAAGLAFAQFIVPGSNFGGKGPRRGSSFAGMSPSGAFDMAGNVREWCANRGRARHYILGGGWTDEPYQFTDAYQQDAFDRSPINGFRLIRTSDESPDAGRALMMNERDYSKEKPAPDIVFQSYRRMYDYDPTLLSAKTDFIDSSAADWTVERVSYAAAYGGERIPAILMLPKRAKPPYQVVVYFPGSNAIHTSSSAGVSPQMFDFILRSGRAVLHPIYKSTYERRDSLSSDYADESIFYRDHVLMWGKDFRRSVDYISSRKDLDSSLVAYYGVSWGGFMGGILPAIEPRIKAVILYVAGLGRERAKPEVDPINFLPRVRQPTLMLNGKYDHFFPIESAQKPFFALLGTPAEHKRYVVYEGGHNVPRERLISETLQWLDKYLGAPR